MNGERTNTATNRAGEARREPHDSPHDPRGRRRLPAHTTADFANGTTEALFPNAKRERSERYSPVPVPRFAHHGPTDPVLGANPSSEGTDPFCRLPLPTLMPSTRGCTPWRPAADGGYGPARELRKPDPDFPGPPKAHRTPPEPRRSTGTFSVSPDEPIPRTWSFTKKRELFPGLPATSPGSLASPRFRPRSSQAPPKQRRHPRALSESGFGNINPIPFRREAGRSLISGNIRYFARSLTDPAPFGKTFARVLGPTDPCSTAVGTEPFSTSVFEGLVRIFATTTEICTRGRLHPGSRPRLPCSPRRPPTRRGIGLARR